MVERPHALVLRRVFGEPLAQKPNLEVLLRCRWAPGVTFPPATVARIGAGVASALAHLHAHGICHGVGIHLAACLPLCSCMPSPVKIGTEEWCRRAGR
jgi:hypothetical protein